ncbi:hydrogenase maturation protease [Archaeoglobus veneficus SNP6]|uniref:Hydrogenase maturation protease n=2 Tax=Archaeoglobus veneficus TaxID=58290 RepID=F2KRB7_ARCVS|nr:hydrogenase maturation protease [Archaeoglobus veneficus SNP6]
MEKSLDDKTEQSGKMKKLVVGIGNAVLGDDSIGIRVAKELENEFEVKVTTPSALLEAIAGYDRVVIVDAISGAGEIGDVFEVELPENPRFTSSHSLGIIEMLSLGKVLYPEKMPKEVRIVAIEVGRMQIGEGLSEEVERALEKAVAFVREILS